MAEFNLGIVIQNKRKENKLTQEELAKEMGVSKSSVSKWETGQTYPDIYLLPRLATFFNITIDQLMGYESQLTKEQIKTIYVEYSQRFGNEDFEEVFLDLKTMIKKYYASLAFVIQMATLLLNYGNFAAENRQTDIINFIITLTKRVKAESSDPSLITHANMIESYCYLQLKEFDKTLDLLNHELSLYMGEEQLLANAYLAKGEVEQAKEVLQAAQYQHLIGMISTCSDSLLHEISDIEKFDKIIFRGTTLIELYQLKELHPAMVLTFLNNVFIGYTQQFRINEALKTLEETVNLMLNLVFPVEIHGDAYFNLLDKWIANQIGLIGNMPRDEKTIKKSLIDFYETYPLVVSTYNNNQLFKELISKLKENIGDN